MLNDPAYVEMALALADRILTESKAPNERVNYAFGLTLGRSATSREVKIIEELVRSRGEYYRENQNKLNVVLKSPKFFYKPRHENKIELATWFHVANALLNLDEVMTRN
jgi:hypothetical protein